MRRRSSRAGAGSRAAEEAAAAFPESEGDVPFGRATPRSPRRLFWRGGGRGGELPHSRRGRGAPARGRATRGPTRRRRRRPRGARARVAPRRAAGAVPRRSQSMASERGSRRSEAARGGRRRMAVRDGASASSTSVSRRVERRVARARSPSPTSEPRMKKGSEWRPVGGALTSSGTVHVRSVAVLRQTHPGGTFVAARRPFGDENASSAAVRRRERGNGRRRSDAARRGASGRRVFVEKVPAGSWTRASPTTSTSPRRARDGGAARGGGGARGGAASRAPARGCPARLRPRKSAATAEGVDKAPEALA